VEKVIIGSSFYTNPDIVSQLAVRYGAQSIVVCLDVDKGLIGKWKVKSVSGTRKQEQNPEALAIRAANAGAGEIVLHAIHKEGAMSGYDLPLIQLVSAAVGVPVVALGGARGIPDFLDAIQAGASAVAASSTFIYNRNNVRSILINYPTQTQLSEEQFNKI
jgi:cyclase